VALVADAIRDVTRRNDIVLDPFCGSGTTIIAAHKTGRRGYGLELDPIYVDVAIRRWQKLTGKTARLAATGKTFEETAELRAALVETSLVPSTPVEETCV
jgi:DNA modification methylase